MIKLVHGGDILEIPDGQPLHGRYPVQKLGEEENK